MSLFCFVFPAPPHQLPKSLANRPPSTAGSVSPAQLSPGLHLHGRPQYSPAPTLATDKQRCAIGAGMWSVSPGNRIVKRPPNSTSPRYSSPQEWDPWPHLSPLHSQIPSPGKIYLSDYSGDTQDAGEEKTQKGRDVSSRVPAAQGASLRSGR